MRADDLGAAFDELRVQVLVTTLRGDVEAAKRNVATALAQLGEPGADALVRGLEGKSPVMRRCCAIALRYVEARPAEAVPRLIALIREADAGKREEIATTLVLFADIAPQHASFYLGAAKGDGSMPRRFGYLGLSRTRPTSETVPAMIEALGDSDREIREIALATLVPKEWWTMRERWERFELLQPIPWPRLWEDPEFARYRASILERLVPLLGAPEYRTRALAADGLGRADAALPEPALPALRNALSDPDPDVRWRAAVALSQLVERGLAPRAELLSMLGSGDSARQEVAAETAWRIGDDAAWAKEALLNLWDTSESQTAVEAAGAALGRMGAGSDNMVALLARDYAVIDPWEQGESDLKRRDRLGEKLRAMKGAYESLVRVAKGQRRDKQRPDEWLTLLDPGYAIRALAAFPDRKDESIAAVEGILGSPSSLYVRLRSIEFLLQHGAPKEACEDRLGHVIDTLSGYDLVQATRLLLRVNPGSGRAVPRLLHGLFRGDEAHDIAELLADIDRLPAAAKTPLLRAAKYGDEETRRGAVRALGNLEEPDEEVREFLWARVAARSITSPAAADALAAMARSEDDFERLIKAGWLPSPPCDPARTAMVCNVLSRLDVDDADLSSVLRCLEEIAPESPLVWRVYLRALLFDLDVRTDEHGDSKRRLLDHDPRGDPALLALLTEQLLTSRAGVAAALFKLAGPEDLTRISAALEAALHLPETKRDALVALGALGPKAASALPAIRALEADKELGQLARTARAQIER